MQTNGQYPITQHEVNLERYSSILKCAHLIAFSQGESNDFLCIHCIQTKIMMYLHK